MFIIFFFTIRVEKLKLLYLKNFRFLNEQPYPPPIYSG